MTQKIARSYKTAQAFTEVTPVGAACDRVNAFVMLGGLSDNRYAVRWCAIGDPTDWPTPATDDARTKQAGQEVLAAKNGWVTGIAGGDLFAYIFQENAITKATYVGGEVVFTFDTLTDDIGCVAPGRHTKSGNSVFFQSDRGYHALTNGAIQDLGYGRTDAKESITIDGEPPYDELFTVATNTARRLVFFPNSASDICYNYATNQWTDADYNVTPNGGNYFDTHTRIDVGVSMVYGSAGYAEVSTGSVTEDATFETSAVDLNEGGRVVVTGVRPIVIGENTVAVRIGVQDNPDDSVTWSASTTPNTRTKIANFRSEGRYVRVELVLSGGFTTMKGVDVFFEPAGQV